MIESEYPRTHEDLVKLVDQEIVKALMMIGCFTEEFWQEELALPVDGNGAVEPLVMGARPEEVIDGPSREPVVESSSGSAEYPIRQMDVPNGAEDFQASTSSQEPVTGEKKIDRLEGGKSDSEPIIEGGYGTRASSLNQHALQRQKVTSESNLGPSTEPITPKSPEGGEISTEVPMNGEKPETERFIGQVGAEPNFHRTSQGVPRIIFPLVSEEQTHTVYSTKERAEMIHAMELMPGEPVKVAGVRHQWLGTDNNPTPWIYAWGVQRKEENGREEKQTV